jgi:hypothetical protein
MAATMAPAPSSTCSASNSSRMGRRVHPDIRCIHHGHAPRACTCGASALAPQPEHAPCPTGPASVRGCVQRQAPSPTSEPPTSAGGRREGGSAGRQCTLCIHVHVTGECRAHSVGLVN